jgi:hypothetical protein
MGSPWYSRDIAAVADTTGVLTQLFPTGADKARMTSTVAAYPPATSGSVRRAIHGRIDRMQITGDGTNSGILELWDVGGTDRGAIQSGGGSNVNNGDLLSAAYATANGKLIGKINVLATGAGAALVDSWADVPFNNGLAVRFISSAGVVSVAPFVQGGFMIQEVHS